MADRGARGATAALTRAGVVGYLLGTTPSADVAARLASGGATDLRRTGSGNPGAVNAMDALGRAWGWGVLFADIAKGALACVAGGRLAGSVGANLAGTAAVLGHCYPVWNGFRGGKGVAVSSGQCLATFPAYFPIDLGVAYVAGRRRGRALPATAIASAVWVASGVLWWRRSWPNGWAPRGDPALPACAAASSAVILLRFATARRPAIALGPRRPPAA
jgi:acyl phosphate:glycerol-3-phosphate acyltransferase